MSTDVVHVFEVGPRDGLQNEAKSISLANKIQFVHDLVKAGVKDLELGAFVRPDRVPQMADTDKIYRAIELGHLRLKKARSWCLVPNRKGLQRALRGGATRIAVFTAATNTFAKKNIGMTVQESLVEFRDLIRDARDVLGPALQVRGYVSTAFGCPFEGKVSPKQSLRVIEKLANLGVDQVSIGDTIGVATPADVKQIVASAIQFLGVAKTAIHLHDTRGTALANALRSLDLGVRILDSSAGGLGGCPFAPGASGNLATEDLVYMLNGMGMKSGIDLPELCEASLNLAKKMKRPLTSRYLQTYATQCRREM